MQKMVAIGAVAMIFLHLKADWLIRGDPYNTNSPQCPDTFDIEKNTFVPYLQWFSWAAKSIPLRMISTRTSLNVEV